MISCCVFFALIFFSFIQIDFGCEVDMKNFAKCVGKNFFGIPTIDKHTVLCMYSTFIVERQSCFIVQYYPLYMTDTTTCYLACCVVPALCQYKCKSQWIKQHDLIWFSLFFAFTIHYSKINNFLFHLHENQAQMMWQHEYY